eukprot:g8906.t1
MSNLVAETLQGIARNRLGELFLFCNNNPEKQPFEKVTIPPELRRKYDGLSKREIEEVCPQTKHQWNQNSRYRGAAKAWDDGLGSEKEVTRVIIKRKRNQTVRDGAFIANVQLPSNKVVLGPQKSIETSEGVGEIMPAPGMIIEFPQRWEQGLNQTKFNKMCKKHILVVRTVDATAIGGAVESRELQLLDKYFLSIGHTLALPDHIKEDFEKDIMPLLKPYAGKPTEPPFLHRFRKKELLLAIQANKLKKAAGTRKSGRVKIDRSLADEVIEESPPKKNKKADFDQESSDDEVITQEKTQEKKKTKKGKGDKEEEEKGGKEALGEAEGLSKLRADISNMSSSISQLVKTLQERPVVRVRRERVKKRRRLDDTDANDSEEED